MTAFNWLDNLGSFTMEQLPVEAGIAIVKKVFGIVLLAIAAELFSSNTKQLFI